MPAKNRLNRRTKETAPFSNGVKTATNRSDIAKPWADEDRCVPSSAFCCASSEGQFAFGCQRAVKCRQAGGMKCSHFERSAIRRRCPSITSRLTETADGESTQDGDDSSDITSTLVTLVAATDCRSVGHRPGHGPAASVAPLGRVKYRPSARRLGGAKCRHFCRASGSRERDAGSCRE